MVTEIYLPKFGQTMEEARVVRWLKSEGEKVKKGDSLLEVETDKSIMDIESEAEGVIRKILVREDEAVAVGTILGYIGGPDDELPENTPAFPGEVLGKELDGSDGKSESNKESTGDNSYDMQADIKAVPSARKLAKEHGIDLRNIIATGAGNIITVKNVEDYMANTGMKADSSGKAPEWEIKETAGIYEIEKSEELTPIRKQMARRLKSSLDMVLHTCAAIEIDAGALRDFINKQKQDGSRQIENRITYNDVFVSVTAKILGEYPQFNSVCDGSNIKYVKNINIGVAVGIEGGLVVPVIRNADRKSIGEISSEMRQLAGKARSGKLMPEEYSYGTFTISNLGMFGIDSFTSIVNPPESAILGIGGIIEKPRAMEGRIVIRPVVKITLNYDHRIADGVSCSQFLNRLKKICEEYDR